jgi:GntR family transcriptional repressor for pyruvate dehydrogenase complex
MVLDGELRDGYKLPSERELAEQFQTSRVPVREALKILEFLGIVENIRGDGTYIKNIGITDLLSKIFFGFKVNDNTLAELFDVRLLLECYAVKIAAFQRTADDLDKMRKALKDMEDAISLVQSPDQASLDFHSIVVNAAGNTILIDIYIFLRSLLALSRKYTLRTPERLKISLEYHRKVFSMITKHDAESAEHFMRDHLLDEKARLVQPDSDADE